MSRGPLDCRSLMWLTDLFLSAAATAAAAAADLPVPRHAQGSWSAPKVGIFIMVVAGGGRLSLDAGGTAGAGAVSLSLREKEFVEAARALGASPMRQVLRAHPAQFSLGPGDRGRHHRRGRCHHRRERRCPSSAWVSRRMFPPGAGMLYDSQVTCMDIAPALGPVPGRGDLHHGAVDQLHGRRPARCAGPAPGDVGHTAMADLAPADQGPQDPFQATDEGMAACGRRHRPRSSRRGETAGRRGRVGLWQERHRHDDHETAWPCRPARIVAGREILWQGRDPGAALAATEMRKHPREGRSPWCSRSR